MNEILQLINEMSPYLLLGFLIAGLMHAFIPNKLYTRYLSDGSLRSVIYAALIGVPLPLCSCGVIPTAMSMRREGASKGATVSFLIATPQTGIDSIFATYSLLGLPFAIIRPIVALITAVFGGQAVNLFDKKQDTKVSTTNNDCCNQDCCCHASEAKTVTQKLIEALHYGFVEMMSDIGKWLVIGLVIAGLITILVPQEFFALFANNSILSILLVLCISIPMYVCATGSIPIAVALMMKGLTPGAALVLLMAGPAANAASILVINKVLGRKTLIIYITSITLGAIIFGLGIDYLLPRDWFITTFTHTHDACCTEPTSPFNIGCTILMGLLLLYSLIMHLLKKGHHHHEHDNEINLTSNDITTTDMKANTIQLHIEGMNCSHCAHSAENALKSVSGVESASVNLASKTATITGEASVETLIDAVNSLGFTASTKA